MATADQLPARAVLEDWSYYEAPLERMLRESGQWRKYPIEFIRQAVRAGQLLGVRLSDDDGSRCGFALLSIDRWPPRRTLVLWMVYLEPGTVSVVQFWPELRRLARRFRCRRIEWQSSRPGAWRAAQRWGWKEVSRVYAVEVDRDGR